MKVPENAFSLLCLHCLLPAKGCSLKYLQPSLKRHLLSQAKLSSSAAPPRISLVSLSLSPFSSQFTQKTSLFLSPSFLLSPLGRYPHYLIRPYNNISGNSHLPHHYSAEYSLSHTLLLTACRNLLECPSTCHPRICSLIPLSDAMATRRESTRGYSQLRHLTKLAAAKQAPHGGLQLYCLSTLREY